MQQRIASTTLLLVVLGALFETGKLAAPKLVRKLIACAQKIYDSTRFLFIGRIDKAGNRLVQADGVFFRRAYFTPVAFPGVVTLLSCRNERLFSGTQRGFLGTSNLNVSPFYVTPTMPNKRLRRDD